MDIQARPEIPSKTSPRDRAFYALVKCAPITWLPVWTKLLLLKMVRRRIGTDNMTLLRDTALKQLTQEQRAKARENLRNAGLL